MDICPELLEVARKRTPSVLFHLGDMTDFDLSKQFDIVTCLFSSIGYVKTLDKLQYAMRSMVAHLKPEGVLVIEPWFTPENWQLWINSLAPDSGNIQLPKFTLEYELKMNDVLKTLGMGIAFDPGADFSRMFQGGGVWIDKVKHKTFVQVDEEGTEAAAVTVVIMIRSGSGSPTGFTMRVDRPFVFVIRERTSGALLFLGKIVEPVWEEG